MVQPDEITLSHDGTTASLIARYGRWRLEFKGPVSGIKVIEREKRDGVVSIDCEYEGFTLERAWQDG